MAPTSQKMDKTSSSSLNLNNPYRIDIKNNFSELKSIVTRSVRQRLLHDSGLLGLQNAAQVDEFLKTPAGKSYEERVWEVIAEKINQQENAILMLQIHKLQVQQALSFFLDEWFAEEEGDHVRHLLNQEAVKHAIERSEGSKASTIKNDEDELEHRLNDYDEELKNLSEEQEKTKKELNQLDKEAHSLETEEKAIESKYEKLYAIMDEIASSLQLSQSSEQEAIISVEQDVTKQIEEKTDDLVGHITNHNPEATKKTLENTIGLHFAKIVLEQIQRCKNGDAQCYSADGNRVEPLMLKPILFFQEKMNWS